MLSCSESNLRFPIVNKNKSFLDHITNIPIIHSEKNFKISDNQNVFFACVNILPQMMMTDLKCRQYLTKALWSKITQ